MLSEYEIRRIIREEFSIIIGNAVDESMDKKKLEKYGASDSSDLRLLIAYIANMAVAGINFEKEEV